MGKLTFLLLVTSLYFLNGCSQKSLPYEGPVMKPRDVSKTFQPILDFMEYKAGMSVADVGAGSGVLTVMMASLMNESVVYIQDIDTTVLRQKNIDKVLDYYTDETGRDLRKVNAFRIAIGGIDHTNLPDNTFDRIYSNATVHNFTEIDAMMQDIKRKLKPGGIIFFRDSFKGDHGEGERCGDPKCNNKLLTIDEFMAIMTRNGFTMIKKSPDMSGYPVFGFVAS